MNIVKYTAFSLVLYLFNFCSDLISSYSDKTSINNVAAFVEYKNRGFRGIVDDKLKLIYLDNLKFFQYINIIV